MRERFVVRFFIILAVAALGYVVPAASAFAAQANEQFIPIFSFKTGPAAPLGIATGAGYVDYMSLLDRRDGGIGGVKLVWQECETARTVKLGMKCYEELKDKGPTGASIVDPVSTDLAYLLLKHTRIDKIPIMTGGYGVTAATDGRVFPYMFPIGTNYWSGNTAMVRYIGLRLGGMSHLRGKTIVNLHHDSAFGRETEEILDLQAQKYGFHVVHIAVPKPGTKQDEQWKRIVDINPDWVILRGIGLMNPVALMTAHKYGYPASRILGVIWAGAEADVIPAGEAAKGYIAGALSLPGKDFPVVQDIIKYDYSDGRHGGLPDVSAIGSTYYNRGLSSAILVSEAIRTAQSRFGKRPLTGEQVRWGMENLNLTDRRIAEIGAFGISQPVRLSCADHEGGGALRFQRWNGKEWQPVTGWIDGDQSLVRPLVEKAAAKYARAHDITPRDCPDEIRRIATQ